MQLTSCGCTSVHCFILATSVWLLRNCKFAEMGKQKDPSQITLRRALHTQYPRYHSNCAPKRAAFRLQQVLGTNAACAESPTCLQCVGAISSKGMGLLRQSAGLTAPPAL